MLRSLKHIQGYKVRAKDGNVGTLHSYFFDEKNWRFIRYMVVDSGQWLNGRKVLLSPIVIEDVDWVKRIIDVSLTKEQIEKSPDIDVHKPISQQREEELLRFYNLPVYWETAPPPPVTMKPGITPPTQPAPGVLDAKDEKLLEGEEEKRSPLRSTREVMGYNVDGRDGRLGMVEDFIAEDEEWIIRYLVVDTGEWLSDKKVLVSPYWIERISWAERTVFVDLFRESVKNAPGYDLAKPVNREYETVLYDYYGRPSYWQETDG